MKNKLFTVLMLILVAAVGVQGYFLYRISEQVDSRGGDATAFLNDNGVNPSGPLADQWNPAVEMQHLQARIDRLFKNTFPQMDGNKGQSGGLFQDDHMTPSLDLEDEGDRYRLKVNIPGADKSELHVGIKGDRVLTIDATTRQEKDNDKGHVLHHERFVGNYRRTLTLPEAVDPDTMHSNYEDGVLTLTVKKAAAVS